MLAHTPTQGVCERAQHFFPAEINWLTTIRDKTDTVGFR